MFHERFLWGIYLEVKTFVPRIYGYLFSKYYQTAPKWQNLIILPTEKHILPHPRLLHFFLLILVNLNYCTVVRIYIILNTKKVELIFINLQPFCELPMQIFSIFS